jgi:hypothetical protein
MRRELIVDPFFGVRFTREIGPDSFTFPEDFPFAGFGILPKFVTLILIVHHFHSPAGTDALWN